MIPQSFIQDLLARVDIVDVIGRSVQLKKGGQNFLGLCPFHAEKSPSFTVSPAKQFYHCFGCGVHGSAIGFVMEHRGLGYVDAIRELAQSVGLSVPVSSPAAEAAASRSTALTDLLQQAGDFYRRSLKESETAVAYLKARGLSGQTAARYGLGFAPDAWQPLRQAFTDYDDARLVESGLVIADEGKRYDRFRGRVMFPIRNARGSTIGFGARVIGPGEPKYLNSPETPVFRKGQELYGLFEGREAIRQSGRAIVCEGYMDVIRLAQAGFGESVAALGTAVTATHVSALLRITDHVVFAFDGDAAGRKAARRALEATLAVIGDSKRASFVLLAEEDDPDSVIEKQGPEGFERALKGALPLSQFLLTELGAARSMRSAEDRAAVVAEARPLMLSMPSSALRLQLLRELSDATRTPMDDLESLYGLRPGQPRRPAPLARRSSLAEVADLKRRILSQLLIHPALADSFADAIATEHLDSDEPLDLAIVEVWRAAAASDVQSASITHGALLELLADSPRIDEFRAAAAREMEVDTEAENARADLEGAFQKLRQQRLEQVRSARLAAYEHDPSPERLDAYRAADLAYTEARAILPVAGT